MIYLRLSDESLKKTEYLRALLDPTVLLSGISALAVVDLEVIEPMCRRIHYEAEDSAVNRLLSPPQVGGAGGKKT